MRVCVCVCVCVRACARICFVCVCTRRTDPSSERASSMRSSADALIFSSFALSRVRRMPSCSVEWLLVIYAVIVAHVLSTSCLIFSLFALFESSSDALLLYIVIVAYLVIVV